jgi:hypothetical protein
MEEDFFSYVSKLVHMYSILIHTDDNIIFPLDETPQIAANETPTVNGVRILGFRIFYLYTTGS